MPAPIGAEDLYRFRWIDHVRLSRDGERVAYQLSWADEESRQNRSRVVVRRLLEPEPVEVTAGPRRDHSPEWSPDGRRVVFLSRRGAVDQVFVLDVAGNTGLVQVSSVFEGASGPLWSPDGSHIAFVGTVLSDADAVVDDPRPPESSEQLRRAPVARLARRLDYKHDGLGYVDGRYQHLFVVPATGGEAKQLTSGAWDVTGFDWSPDGTTLVVAGNAEPGADLQRALNLYVVDLAGNRAKLAGGFYLGSPSWSPRGDFIAFVAPNGLDAGLMERLWIVPSDGGAQRCLTIGFDQAVGGTVISDMRGGHDVRVSWSADGERVFFLSSASGTSGLYSSDLEGKVRPEVSGQRSVFDFDVAAGVIAFCASDTTHPGELHMVTQGAEARLTDLNPWLRERYVAQPEHHSFTAPDGWVLDGWLLKPDGFDPSHNYPLILQIHGGPHSQYGWTFFHEFQILAGMGYLVMYLNPRGSDGYGEHFRRQVVRDWGGKDFIDLMSALDQLIEATGFVDVKRLGVAGGSYGGYMTNWVIGQTNRFAAAVAMRSISNLVSEYAQHDIVLWGALEMGPPPWPDLDELWRRSPIRYVQNIQTPLLLTCGEMDLRCAISQSEEMFGAMRFLRKTVEMVRFPQESHDISRNGRPDRRVERLRRIAAWFERFIATAPSDRELVSAETQTLEVPRADAATEVLETVPPTPAAVPEPEPVMAEAETVAIEPLAVEPEPEAVAREPVPVEPEAVADEAAEEAEAPPPAVEAPTYSALPVFPEPEPVVAQPEPLPGPEAIEAEPEAIEPEPEAEPEPAPAPEMATEAEMQAIDVMELEPERELPPEPAPAPEPEPEPVIAAEAEVVDVAPPEPEMADVQSTAPPEPAPPEPEPAVYASEQAAAEPAPAPVEASAFPEPEAPAPGEPAPDRLAQTLIAWPSAGAGGSDNGAPATASGEEATSIIPAWQSAETPSETRRTVSLRAMPPEAIASGDSYPAKLTFESGPFAGRIVALPNQMVTVGRAPDNDLVVGDPATSGRHGRIEVRAGDFWISDLGSTNGTLVNGEPVVEKQLNHGDLIAIGQNTIRFTLE